MIGLQEAWADEDAKPELVLTEWLPRQVEALFGPKGYLHSDMGLEYRELQGEMALWTAQAFSSDKPLLYEAGTGVGKSLAYLLPALLMAKKSKRQAFVSTHTIALQEQIQKKDLEICRGVFQAIEPLREFADFKTALMLGKGNYLCNNRLKAAMRDRQTLLALDGGSDLDRIAEWANHTTNGLIQELQPSPSPEVWDLVNADSSACNNRNCNSKNCCYRRAREQMRQADMLIVNHSLLFALLGAGYADGLKGRGILHGDDFGIIDEAHTIPSVAAEYFGHRLSEFGLQRLLFRLYNPQRLDRPQGLLAKSGSADAKKAVRAVWAAQELFFNHLESTWFLNASTVRLFKPGWGESNLLEPMRELSHALGEQLQRMEDGQEKDELDGARKQVQAARQSLVECLDLAETDHAYWLESIGKRKRNIIIRSAPVDVSSYLREALFKRQTSVLLTSATLAEGATMDSFQHKIGAVGLQSFQSASPFDYERQMRVFIATDMPRLNDASGMDLDWLADTIAFCSLRVSGGTLVLFTSYRDMFNCARQLTPLLDKARRPFFIQGQSGSRMELVRNMRSSGNGILFGTDSFWTGVDIPGPALSQVIITRLPFENPSHPLASARADWCQTRGGNSFRDLQLPEAVVKFRQGLGRLIRGPSDFGTLTLLDSRLLQRPYGRAFLEVVPTPHRTTFTRSTRAKLFQPLEL